MKPKATKQGIVYDKKTLAIRHVVIPDHDDQLPLHVGKGEEMVTVPIGTPCDPETLYAIVKAHTGRTPPTFEEVHAMDEVDRQSRG